jgi:hypothetical protein
MPTDADDQARVRDPAIELLLSHTATLTGEWCSRRRARRPLGLRIGEIRPAAKWFHPIGRQFAALCVSDVDHPSATTSEPRPARPRSAKRHSRSTPTRSDPTTGVLAGHDADRTHTDPQCPGGAGMTSLMERRPGPVSVGSQGSTRLVGADQLGDRLRLVRTRGCREY